MRASEPKRAAIPPVRQYMTPDPKTLEIADTLLDAVLLLRQSKMRHIPILNEGHVVGVLTDRDIWRFSPTMLLPLSQQDYNRVFEETTVGKVMTRNPLTISPESPLSEAVQLLYKNKLGCLPVVEQDRLVGIITVRDMLRALYEVMDGPADGERGNDALAAE